MDDLLAEGATAPLDSGAGFYSNVYIILNTLVVYDSYPILSDLIMICTCLLSDRYSNLLSKVIMLFSIDLKDVGNIFLLLSTTVIFTLCWATYTL